MKSIKTLVCMIIVIFIVSCSYTTIPAFADETRIRVFRQNQNLSLATVSYSKGLYNAIISGWDNYQSQIDISAYKINVNKINDIYNYICNLHPEYFYIASNYEVYYNSSTNIISSILVSYTATKAEIKQQKSKFAAECQKIINKMGSGMRDEDKIVFLHDYISTHNSYDPNGVSGDSSAVDDYSFNAYGCIVNHISVCQGMSDAFIHLANLAGLTAKFVDSRLMSHAWNIVKLGNYYYHLDITWDDSASSANLNFLNVNGFVDHTYLMKSDSQMETLSHNNWNAEFSATDSTTFNNYYWNDVHSSIYYIKGYRYYVSDSKLIKSNIKTKQSETVYSFQKGTFNGADGKLHSFLSNYTTIAYDYMGNSLVFNTASGVYALNLYTNTVTKVIEAPTTGYIAGVAFFDDTLYYDIVDYDDKSKRVQTADLTTTISYPDYNIIYGDCDESGSIDALDVLILRKMLAGISVNISEFTADVNNDNSVNAKDLLLIKKHIAGQIPQLGGK